jgi:hypothetical protein
VLEISGTTFLTITASTTIPTSKRIYELRFTQAHSLQFIYNHPKIPVSLYPQRTKRGQKDELECACQYYLPKQMNLNLQLLPFTIKINYTRYIAYMKKKKKNKG